MIKNFFKSVIPETTLRRMVYYTRCLNNFKNEGVRLIQSEDIAKKCGVKSSVVRKDLSYFGEFGVRGKGYDVESLLSTINGITNTFGQMNAALIGVGKLGSAIIKHSTENFNVKIIAAFDKDRKKVNKEIGETKVFPIEEIESVIKKYKIKIAIIAIPPPDVQKIVDILVKAGIKAILSLALIPLNVPDDVEVSFVDVLSEVEFLFYKLSLRRNI